MLFAVVVALDTHTNRSDCSEGKIVIIIVCAYKRLRVSKTESERERVRQSEETKSGQQTMYENTFFSQSLLNRKLVDVAGFAPVKCGNNAPVKCREMRPKLA